MTQKDLGDLIRRYRLASGITQTTVAHELGQVLGRAVHQTLVSDNEKGTRWNDPDLAGAYVRVLKIPGDEMAAAQGWSLAKGPRPVTLADVVKADPTLSAAAKKHLLSQYGLLQLATQQERSGKPVLKKSSDRTKSRRSAAG